MNFEVNPSVVMEDMQLLKKIVGEMQQEISSVNSTVSSLVGTAWTSQVATAYQSKIQDSINKSNSYLDELNRYLGNVYDLAQQTQEAESNLANQFGNM